MAARWNEILENTRDFFEKNPDKWTTGTYRRNGGEVCLIGGLQQEAYKLELGVTNSEYKKAYESCSKAAASLIRKMPLHRFNGSEYCPESYNDRYARNVQGVIKLLDLAIEGGKCEEDHGK